MNGCQSDFFRFEFTVLTLIALSNGPVLGVHHNRHTVVVQIYSCPWLRAPWSSCPGTCRPSFVVNDLPSPWI